MAASGFIGAKAHSSTDCITKKGAAENKAKVCSHSSQLGLLNRSVTQRLMKTSQCSTEFLRKEKEKCKFVFSISLKLPEQSPWPGLTCIDVSWAHHIGAAVSPSPFPPWPLVQKAHWLCFTGDLNHLLLCL